MTTRPFPLPPVPQLTQPGPPAFVISVAHDGTAHLCRAQTRNGRRQAKRVSALDHLSADLTDRLRVWLAIALAGRRTPGIYAPAEPVPQWLRALIDSA